MLTGNPSRRPKTQQTHHPESPSESRTSTGLIIAREGGRIRSVAVEALAGADHRTIILAQIESFPGLAARLRPHRHGIGVAVCDPGRPVLPRRAIWRQFACRSPAGAVQGFKAMRSRCSQPSLLGAPRSGRGTATPGGGLNWLCGADWAQRGGWASGYPLRTGNRTTVGARRVG